MSSEPALLEPDDWIRLQGVLPVPRGLLPGDRTTGEAYTEM